jgi:hypothetical protein
MPEVADSQNPTQPIQPLKRESLFRQGLLRIFRHGAARAIDDQTGLNLSENGDEAEKKNKLRGWFASKRAGMKRFAGDSLGKAIGDERIQRRGTEYVRESINEAVSEVRHNFDGTLDTVANVVTPKDEKGNELADNRPTYKKIRDLIGYNEDDKWYMKLGKSVGARLAAFGKPILSFISAKAACKFAEKENPQDEQRFREKFGAIYERLLSQFSKPPEKNAPLVTGA